MGHVVRMTLTGAAGVTFMFLIDAANLFWVSLLGVERLMAALGFSWMIQFFSVSFGMGMMAAVIAVVSRLIGQGAREDARRQTTVCAISAFILQALVAGTTLYFRHDLLALAGAKGETAALAARYLMISMPSLPFMAVGMVGSAVLRAEGDAWRAMSITLTSGAVSMVIDPVLIFGLGLGLDGAAIAIVIARLMSASLSVYYVVKVHDLAGRIDLPDFKRLFVPFAWVAGPAILTQLSTPFGNYIATSVIAGYGDSAVAGWAVVSRLTVLTFGGLFALSGAIGGIFGQNYGAGRFDRVKRTYRDALVFCAIYTLIAWVMLALATGFVIRVFGLGVEASEIVRAFTLLAAGGWIFTGALFVANSAFNSLGKPLWSTLFNWLRDGVILWPLAVLFSTWFAASGAIYGAALSGVIVGTAAALTGWFYVARLDRAGQAAYLSAKGDNG
ncbi:MAG: MATE family efflux transporter [Alphaproteobacteria bacterium]|nr:MATE family efflux transporter [Alphaproteobacteria bacterium]